MYFASPPPPRPIQLFTLSGILKSACFYLLIDSLNPHLCKALINLLPVFEAGLIRTWNRILDIFDTKKWEQFRKFYGKNDLLSITNIFLMIYKKLLIFRLSPKPTLHLMISSLIFTSILLSFTFSLTPSVIILALPPPSSPPLSSVPSESVSRVPKVYQLLILTWSVTSCSTEEGLFTSLLILLCTEKRGESHL